MLGGNISQFSLRSQQPGNGLSLQTGAMRDDDCGAAVAVAVEPEVPPPGGVGFMLNSARAEVSEINSCGQVTLCIGSGL